MRYAPTQMKSVLILCDLFPPAFGPRMGYLCKYLAGEGWTPVVVTEQVPGDTFDFLREGVDVTYVPASRMSLSCTPLSIYSLPSTLYPLPSTLYK